MHHKWKSKIKRKQIREHQTPGTTKTDSCQANHVSRHMTKHSRAYKDKNYEAWFDKKKRMLKG